MNVHGFELIGDWKAANRGYTALAKKGGKKYFLKKYGDFKLPRRDSSTTPALYNRLEREFNDFMNNRIAINVALKELAGPGGNIILPLEWFVDDIYYVEATEFVSDLIEDEAILKLSSDEIKFIMLTAAGALHNVHRKNIVHSDLKRTNLLAARNSAGKTVGKLIDFDKSYFTSNIREDELGGDQSYMSPELAQCLLLDLAEEALAYLSVKSDIFSLGLIYHNYLTGGEFPELRGLSGGLKKRFEEGKTVYSGEAILGGAELVVSKKIKEPYLANLIVNMLQLQPEDRPTALEVVEVLRDKKVLGIKEGSRVVLASGTTPAPKPKTAPKKTGGTTPAPKPTPAPVSIPEGFCPGWPEHGITLNEDKLRASGYVAAEQVTHLGSKAYKLYKADGATKVMMPSILTMTGYATKGAATAAAGGTTPTPAPKPTGTSAKAPSGFCAPWPEHSIALDEDRLRASGYVAAEQVMHGSNQAYKFYKADGTSKVMLPATMVLTGFARKV